MICITGAAGYIGSHAALALAEDGAALRVLVRPTAVAEERGFLQSLGAEVVLGEATDPEIVERACAGCRAVLHCVGGIRPERAGDFFSLHEGPAEALAGAAQRAGVEHIVLVSATGADLKADNLYHRSKARAEAILSSLGGSTTTVVRPSLVYGRAGGLRDSKLMARLASDLQARRLIPLPGGGKNLMQPLFVSDLARALALTTAEAVGGGGTVELGGPERVTLWTWIGWMAAYLDVRSRRLHIPKVAALSAAAIAEQFFAASSITVDQVRVMSHNFIAPLDSIEATYGFTPVGPIEGLERTYGPKPGSDA